MIANDYAAVDAASIKYHAGLKAGMDKVSAWKNAMASANHESKTFLEKTIETTKNLFAAAPGFAIVTAAIATVYAAMRALRDEFVAGLKAVEDFQVKVASMTAFMVTFNKNVTQPNLS